MATSGQLIVRLAITFSIDQTFGLDQAIATSPDQAQSPAGGLGTLVEGNVPSLAESLSQVMAVEGARAAALVDIATGMVVRSAGQWDGDLTAAAAAMAEEARLARALPGPGETSGAPQGGDDLEEILLMTSGRLQVSRILSFPFGDGLVLFVDLDRARVNLALASLRIGQLAPAVLV